MVTKEEYDAAAAQRDAAEKVMQAYHKEKLDAFAARWEEFKAGKRFFTDDELHYSRSTLCPCGHGLAYPKNCGPFHQWDCSAVLKGTEDSAAKHGESLPFSFYDVKGEQGKETTRGVFRPKPA